MNVNGLGQDQSENLIGGGKTLLGLVILLIGTGVSIAGYSTEAGKLIEIGEMLILIGVGHKLVKAK